MQKMEGGESAPQLPSHDVLARVRNPGATQDLVIPFVMECNTSDEQVARNIAVNSRGTQTWLGTSEPHGGVALLCGSGPSLADDIDKIKAMVEGGADVFALNGAATFLAKRGIMPFVQFIADARPETAELIGPAEHQLFASQVDPSLFARIPSALLVQVGYGPMPELPEHDGEYAIVIGHSSIGNVALGLAYTMGYRAIHCFGYDSSHRDGAGHAAHQAINDGDPCIALHRDGRDYVASFTMYQQAQIFPRVAQTLIGLGCTVDVHGTGLLPDRWRAERAKTLEQREADKYRAMWERREYRVHSPGMKHVEKAAAVLGIKSGDSLIDFGCGTGRATKAFRDLGVSAAGIDFAPNALEEAVPCTIVALWDMHLLKPAADWGFCCDVMEHIPTERVDVVLRNIAATIGLRGAYFAIDLHHDDMGELIGAPLHLTVRPSAWWHDQLQKHFAIVTELGPGVFVCEHTGYQQEKVA